MQGLSDTLAEGIEYIRNNSETDITFMLSNCFGAVTAITNTVRSEEGELNSVIPLLRKLSDDLLSLSDYSDNTSFEKVFDQLSQQVQNIKSSINTGLTTKLEIAFFPYKSSMWDCMESVWREAWQDEDCSCFVVPIPYYEVNGNGVSSKLCYEGNSFPDYVPVVDYSTYNLEKHHPDIIYFHNPYDQNNLITQVQKTYFSSNLKKYTDMLVYIPYFVAGAYKNIDAARAMCLTSGAISADKVIVQSKLHKELFVKLGFDSEKILALGSPKFDATLRAKEQHSEVPQKWSAKLCGKKVFLWNTTLITLLNEKDWFEKTAKMIEVFSGDTNCALIWRPHPLMKATIQSMRPQDSATYHDLEEKIRSMDNAVIDENSDVYPAIAVSDALLSDYSSIMMQYSITGKPILSLNGNSSMRKDYLCVFDYFSNYFIDDGMTVELFRDMVLRREDFNKEKRLEMMKKSTFNTDGHCGRAVHRKIKALV